jgi:AcrR family transcriptional regulator
MDLILDTAARLLDEVGIEGLNTNLLARRANVRVRTVYRYFPNKYAIFAALTRKLAVHWDAWMTEFYARLAEPGRDWRTAIVENTRQWLLTDLHFQIFEEMSRKMSAALVSRGLRLARPKLLAIARTVISATNVATEI